MGIENKEKLNSEEVGFSINQIIFYINILYKVVIEKWKILLFLSIIGGLIGFEIADNSKPIYKAVITFALEGESSNSGGISSALGLASQFGINLGDNSSGSIFSNSNLSELMKSRMLVESTLLKPIIINGTPQTLANFYLNIYDFKSKFKNNSNLQKVTFEINGNRQNFSLYQNQLLYEIYKNVVSDNFKVQLKEKKSSILILEVLSIDETFSKLFCENLANEVSNFYIQTKIKKAKQNFLLLQKQVDSTRQILNENINEIASNSKNVYNLNPAFNIKNAYSTKKQIDVQSNSAILSQLVGNLELAKITLRKETPLIQVIDYPIYPLEYTKLSKAKFAILGFAVLFIFSIMYFSINYLLKIKSN